MGNPVSSSLPQYLDSFLEDVAQMLGSIDYLDIAGARKVLSKPDIDYLKSIAKVWTSDADEAADSAVIKDNFAFDKDGEPAGVKGRLKDILSRLHSAGGKAFLSAPVPRRAMKRKRSPTRQSPTGLGGLR